MHLLSPYIFKAAAVYGLLAVAYTLPTTLVTTQNSGDALDRRAVLPCCRGSPEPPPRPAEPQPDRTGPITNQPEREPPMNPGSDVRLGTPKQGTGAETAPGGYPKASLGTEAELQAMGLHPGSPQREAFDKFIKYFDENTAGKTDNPWVFYTKTGEKTTEKVTGFRQGYADGKYRLKDEPEATTLHNFIDDFDFQGIQKQLGPGPAPNEALWYDGVISYAAARVASTRGGPVRILMPKDADILPPHKSWTDFEAYELTKPGTKVTELWRYNSDNFDEPPVLAWSAARGDPPLGVQADFKNEMKWAPRRT